MVRKQEAQEKKSLGCEEGLGGEDSGQAGKAEGEARFGVVGVDFTVIDYLKDRGVTASLLGGTVTITCKACKKRRELKISNDLGTWTCNGCGRSGGFSSLRRLLGDKGCVSTKTRVNGQAEMLVPDYKPVKYHRDYQKQLKESGQNKLEMLKKLGVNQATLSEFRIGYNKDFDALTFPYLYRRSLGSTSYLRMYREPDDWWKAVGEPSKASWFGQHKFKSGIKRAVITQTPLDAMCLASRGVENVLCGIVDTPKVRLRSHAVALLQRCDEILIAPNATDEGSDWARAMIEQLGEWRCKVVQSDGWIRDIKTINAWEELAAKAADDLGIRVGSVVDWFDELDSEYEGAEQAKGYPTSLEPLDALFGGWRDGELSVLVGEPGSGKSTFAAFLTLLQVAQGRPVLYISFEVSAGRMVRKWAQMLGGGPVSGLNRDEYVAARRKLAKYPLFIPAIKGQASCREVEKVIMEALQRHKIRHVVVDHLGFIEGDESDLFKQQSITTKTLKRVALETGLNVLLLSHFRKRQMPGRHGLDDVLGNGDITRLADNVLVVRRPTDISKGESKPAASTDRRTFVDLVKVRDDEGYEGTVKLNFDVDSLRYSPF